MINSKDKHTGYLLENKLFFFNLIVWNDRFEQYVKNVNTLLVSVQFYFG